MLNRNMCTYLGFGQALIPALWNEYGEIINCKSVWGLPTRRSGSALFSFSNPEQFHRFCCVVECNGVAVTTILVSES